MGMIRAKEIYELSPRDGRKSFYGKAKVFIADDSGIGARGIAFLISYDSVICARDMYGEVERFPCEWNERQLDRDNWSATTGRHIAAFCGLNKKEFLDLPIADVDLSYYGGKDGAFIEY